MTTPNNKRRGHGAHRTPAPCREPSKQAEQANLQRSIIEQCRAESCLDRGVPLGLYAPAPARPEFGSTVGDYYRTKHASGKFGRFWPLHVLALIHGSGSRRSP